MPSSYIELGDDALELVAELKKRFGTTGTAETVARALGLAKVASKYFARDTLTVWDPYSVNDELADQLVDLVIREPASSDEGRFANAA